MVELLLIFTPQAAMLWKNETPRYIIIYFGDSCVTQSLWITGNLGVMFIFSIYFFCLTIRCGYAENLNLRLPVTTLVAMLTNIRPLCTLNGLILRVWFGIIIWILAKIYWIVDSSLMFHFRWESIQYFASVWTDREPPVAHDADRDLRRVFGISLPADACAQHGGYSSRVLPGILLEDARQLLQLCRVVCGHTGSDDPEPDRDFRAP